MSKKKAKRAETPKASEKKAARIEMLKTSDITPYARNTKKHSQEQIDTVARSIQAFGFNAPVLICKDNTIVAGHCRVLAAIKLGMEEVPCIRLEHLDENQRKAYVIADNRLSEVGSSWDYDMLRAELSNINFDGIVELKEHDFGFGFYHEPESPSGKSTAPQEDEDDGLGRFILIYRNEDEKNDWLLRIGAEEGKEKYTVKDIPECEQ